MYIVKIIQAEIFRCSFKTHLQRVGEYKFRYDGINWSDYLRFGYQISVASNAIQRTDEERAYLIKMQQKFQSPANDTTKSFYIISPRSAIIRNDKYCHRSVTMWLYLLPTVIAYN